MKKRKNNNKKPNKEKFQKEFTWLDKTQVELESVDFFLFFRIFE